MPVAALFSMRGPSVLDLLLFLILFRACAHAAAASNAGLAIFDGSCSSWQTDGPQSGSFTGLPSEVMALTA
jgi:hypothetical protein